jgi:peptidoglycan-N-acetylglucosamine deacetylase
LTNTHLGLVALSAVVALLVALIWMGRRSAKGQRRPLHKGLRWVGLSGLLALFGGAIVVALQPPWVFGILDRLLPGILWRVPVSAPLVGLTFDDGPSPRYTPDVLRVLEKHGARATFFIIGAHAKAHPEVLAQTRAAGHELGNHFSGRGSILTSSVDEFVQNLEGTQHTLQPFDPTKLFRPPGGLIRPEQLKRAQELGYTCVLGSAYPYDPSIPSMRYMRWLVGKNLAPGAIVILHDGIPDASATIEALDAILADGTQRGYRFVPVGELLASRRP